MANPAPQTDQELVLILDFGAQYAQLIARRVREQNVFCQLVRHGLRAARIAELKPRGLILSGGPSSVYDHGAPHCDPEIFKLGIPVLGICYGMQEACHVMGGQVQPSSNREFGRAQCHIHEVDGLFAGVSPETEVWMSHGDAVSPRSQSHASGQPDSAKLSPQRVRLPGNVEYAVVPGPHCRGTASLSRQAPCHLRTLRRC
jgi:GMP synthase (glutamine-hydrolysing) A subunit